MKLPEHYFDNLSAAKYREYLRLLPQVKNEHTQLITMLIFTFAALSFFGIFAINPTLTTIVDLKRQVADNQEVHAQMQTKIANLSKLQGQYSEMANDLPVIYNAIPDNPAIPLLTAQVQSLAKQSNLTVTAFRVSEVQVATEANKATSGTSSFVFSLEAEGSYQHMLSFVTSLTHFNRIISLETIGIAKDTGKDNKLVLTIRGRAYFKK